MNSLVATLLRKLLRGSLRDSARKTRMAFALGSAGVISDGKLSTYLSQG